jgi:hypothetical protein
LNKASLFTEKIPITINYLLSWLDRYFFN